MALKIIIKKIVGSLVVFLLACFIFYLGGEAGYQLKYRLELWRVQKEMESFNQSIIDMFKADIYGGATPEETFNMFVKPAAGGRRPLQLFCGV